MWGLGGGGGWGGFSFHPPCQAVGLSLKDNNSLTYTLMHGQQGVGHADSDVHKFIPQQSSSSDRDEERKDRALVDVGGCLLLSLLRFTFSTPVPLIQCRPVFWVPSDTQTGLKSRLVSDFQIPIVTKGKNQRDAWERANRR